MFFVQLKFFSLQMIIKVDHYNLQLNLIHPNSKILCSSFLIEHY